jgi:hypothetical protein
MRHQGDRAIAPYVAVSRFARPGKCNAKIARRAGPKLEFIFARAKSANHQISFENARGGTERVAGESHDRCESLGCGNAVAAVKSRWLRNAGREQGKLLLRRIGQLILPDGQISDFAVQPHLQKYFRSRLTQIRCTCPAVPCPKRGALRTSRTLGAGCGGRGRRA